MREPGRELLVARLGDAAGHLRVDPAVVQRPGQDGHHDSSHPVAAADRPVEVTALPRGDDSDDEPYDEQRRPDAHPDLPCPACCDLSRAGPERAIPRQGAYRRTLAVTPVSPPGGHPATPGRREHVTASLE